MRKHDAVGGRGCRCRIEDKEAIFDEKAFALAINRAKANK
jgi:hypothetical protein